MRRAKVIELAILLIAAAVAYEAYRYRIYIETWGWHVRHGDVVNIAEYRVPAPRNWHVEDVGEESQILIRLDTEYRTGDPSKDKKPRFPAEISLFTRSSMSTPEKLDSWSSVQASMLKKAGVEPVLQKFSFNGETLSCVGGQKFSEAPKAPQFYETDPNTWMCSSSGRLELQIVATDADMKQVWEIVSHIRKRS